jgi:hypothetical protein
LLRGEDVDARDKRGHDGLNRHYRGGLQLQMPPPVQGQT